MSTVTEMNEILSYLKKIKDMEEEREIIRIQNDLVNREIEILSATVQMQKGNVEKQKELLELLEGVLNHEKETNAAASACKSQFARGSFQPLLLFCKQQVKKSELLHDLKQTEVEKKIQKLADDYAGQNPRYRELKQKQKQLIKLQDDLKDKIEEGKRFEKFVAQEKQIEDMMLQDTIVDLARLMVQYNENNVPKSEPAPESTSVALNVPLNAEHELKSHEECAISDAPNLVDTNVNDISVFKLPPQRRAVKRKPNETREEISGFNVKVDTSRTLDDKFKVPAAVKMTNEPSKAPHQLKSILKHKEVIEKPTTLATTQPSQESDESTTLQKKNDALEKPSKTKAVTFVDIDSSVESDIIPLSGINKNDSKSTSKIGSAIESPIDSECSSTSEGNISKHKLFDEGMDQSSIEENTPKSKATEGTSKQANIKASPSFSLDLSFYERSSSLAQQFSTPNSGSITAASTNADVDSDNSNTSAFHLDFGTQDFQPLRQTRSDNSFNLMSFDEADGEFADLFK